MKNPYKAYENSSITTASREELTLMLYEGALKFANQAKIALEKSDFTNTNNYIIRVQDIIREFQVTLNRDMEISKDLDALYDYIYRRLVDANLKKEVAILDECIDLLRDFRDMWKEAMKIAKEERQHKK